MAFWRRSGGPFIGGDGVGARHCHIISPRQLLDHRWMIWLQTDLHARWRLILRGSGESTSKGGLGIPIGRAACFQHYLTPSFCRQVDPPTRVTYIHACTFVDISLYTWCVWQWARWSCEVNQNPWIFLIGLLWSILTCRMTEFTCMQTFTKTCGIC
jgi:hypothetical protein